MSTLSSLKLVAARKPSKPSGLVQRRHKLKGQKCSGSGGAPRVDQNLGSHKGCSGSRGAGRDDRHRQPKPARGVLQVRIRPRSVG